MTILFAVIFQIKKIIKLANQLDLRVSGVSLFYRIKDRQSFFKISYKLTTNLGKTFLPKRVVGLSN